MQLRCGAVQCSFCYCYRNSPITIQQSSAVLCCATSARVCFAAPPARNCSTRIRREAMLRVSASVGRRGSVLLLVLLLLLLAARVGFWMVAMPAAAAAAAAVAAAIHLRGVYLRPGKARRSNVDTEAIASMRSAAASLFAPFRRACRAGWAAWLAAHQSPIHAMACSYMR